MKHEAIFLWAAKLRKQITIILLQLLVKVKTCCIFARSFKKRQSFKIKHIKTQGNE